MRPRNLPHSTLAVPAPRKGRRPPGAGTPKPPKREPQKAMSGPPRDSKVMSWLVFLMFGTLIALFIPPDLTHPMGDLKEFGAPSVALRTTKLTLLFLSLIVIFNRFRLAQSLAKQVNGFFMSIMILIPVSIIWSIDQSATQARFVSLLTVVLVCFAVALVAWSPHRFQQVVRAPVTLFLIGALVVGTLWPEMVLEQGDDISLKDAWHGLASQKNEFGQIASFGVILWLHAWLTRESKWWVAALGLLIAAECLFLSRSSTALLATSLAVPVLFMLQRPPAGMRPYMPYIVAVFTGLVLTYAIAILNIVPGLGILFKPFLALTGKDFTFSNRVLIWQIIKEHIELAPWFGTGYGAYWVGPVPTSPSFVFLSRIWVYPTQSHNGFLEITNDLGFVGMILLLGYLITFVRQSLALFKFDRAEGALFIAIIFQQIMINLSEACFITAKSASANITILATMMLARSLMERRRALRFAPAPVRPSRAAAQPVPRMRALYSRTLANNRKETGRTP